MTDVTPTTSIPYNSAAVGAAIHDITAGLERVMAGFANLKLLLVPERHVDELELDPLNPANKYEVGGLEKLTKRGAETCYRLYDAGKTRYAVASLMQISFGAATHRYK